MTDTEKLYFERIDISFIYGYVNYNLHRSEKLPGKNGSGYNKMWAPIYNLNLPNDGFCIQKDLIKDKPVTIITSTSEVRGIPAKISAHILRKRYDDENFGDTDGGPGCLTIKISVETHYEKGLTTDTIFDILNLAPRISIHSTDLSKIKGLEELLENKSVEIPKNMTDFSDIFKLFRNLLYENQPCWSELYIPPQEKGKCKEDCLKPDKKQCEVFYPFYDKYSEIDPQIPYMLVEGFLPKDLYKNVFIDNSESPKDYTNEIGCLLGRWLNIKNKDHLNTDYYCYYKDIDAIIEKEREVFISRFRDKKTFVVLSSLMTLILKCKFGDNNNADADIAAADNAVELTTNALLSYLEFSRTRLHNALWLNKQLDKLVNEVDDKDTTLEILPIKKKLNMLKVKAAKSMNNPISYMWDSVLGQEIPSLKINRNVEKLESDTIQKLNLINELIADKIQNSQISDFIVRYNSK